MSPARTPLRGSPVDHNALVASRRSGLRVLLSHRFGLRGRSGMKRSNGRMRRMDDRDWLAERFEGHRTHLRAVAYRMLGSLSEADDAVQEAWLKLSRSDAGEIDNLGGCLTPFVALVCLVMLRSRNARREDSLEEHVDAPPPPTAKS